ncbi:methyltransferase domain-containing protein [Leucobacter viscericola]|uniref:Methyltransferase domain-containing protein n=1 Tax=Leucobacter viscericola TaxID=2714935 RepID=A0A6G7XF69_9MICO|nr:class I SAM-dependent methyltransferase [Leucobacter viscericola]QIK63011.1 methyltransferase domain-containing protein [Leucobacter viscericola]
MADPDGHQLMVNKWGRLGHALEAMGSEAQRRILEDATRVVADLTELGLRPFAVGGTLLGGVRDGKLLPHDDDADIAYLSSHTNPADVALESLRVGHRLSDLGYQVLHHSAVHMQLTFPGVANTSEPASGPGHYIDVFAAFFTSDGNINQPFHVRAPMTEAQMLPFGSVALDGFEFPAPADVDHWLTINYDKKWRTPIPGFKIVTPLETRRRFEPWFGGFNFQREYWDDRFASGQSSAEWQTGRDWLVGQDFDTPFIVDLGCGLGELSRQLMQKQPSRQVLGLDFSTAALDRAAATPASNLSFGRLNLNRLQSIALTRRFSITGPFSVVANHLFEELGHHARENAWRITRMSLRSGGSVFFVFNARPAADVSIDDPSGWHLTRDQVIAEAARFGLTVDFVSLDSQSDREPVGAQVRLADPEPELRTNDAMHTSRRTP